LEKIILTLDAVDPGAERNELIWHPEPNYRREKEHIGMRVDYLLIPKAFIIQEFRKIPKTTNTDHRPICVTLAKSPGETPRNLTCKLTGLKEHLERTVVKELCKSHFLGSGTNQEKQSHKEKGAKEIAAIDCPKPRMKPASVIKDFKKSADVQEKAFLKASGNQEKASFHESSEKASFHESSEKAFHESSEQQEEWATDVAKSPAQFRKFGEQVQKCMNRYSKVMDSAACVIRILVLFSMANVLALVDTGSTFNLISYEFAAANVSEFQENFEKRRDMPSLTLGDGTLMKTEG